MSLTQQPTLEGSKGSIIVHVTPDGLNVVHANSSNSSDIAQPAAEPMEVPNGALIAHHFTVAMQRQKDASISPADQTGEAANMHEVEHTQATADIYYGPSAQGRD